jgi:hypothetical protein
MFTRPYNGLVPLKIRHRLLLSRAGGGRDEKKIYKGFEKAKASENEARASGFGSQ